MASVHATILVWPELDKERNRRTKSTHTMGEGTYGEGFKAAWIKEELLSRWESLMLNMELP